MRIDVNLATRPYEDIRSFYVRWGVMVAILAALAVGLWGLAIYRYTANGDIRAQVREAKAELERLQQQRKQAEQVLAQPQNAPVRQRSDFLNALIARKAFSWTQVFTDLEKIMPGRVQVVALKPEVTKENQLELRLQVSSQSREAVLELVRKMEESDRFRQARVRSEAHNEREDTIEVEVSTLYVLPSAPASGAAAGGAD